MKKLLIAFIAILCMSFCLFSCGNKVESDGFVESESVETIVFTEKSVVVEIYETAILNIQCEDGKQVTWRSTNPEKLTVDQNGVVFGKMAGTVTVYASDGESEAACIVTIIDSGYIPMLIVDLPSQLVIACGEDFTLSPYVTYNGNKYYNATYTYSASGCISVKNGVITANSVGNGSVTITANWHEVESETLTIIVDVTVIA